MTIRTHKPTTERKYKMFGETQHGIEHIAYLDKRDMTTEKMRNFGDETIKFIEVDTNGDWVADA